MIFGFIRLNMMLNGGKEQKIPLSRRELENLIGDGGKVVRTQGEYMEIGQPVCFLGLNPLMPMKI